MYEESKMNIYAVTRKGKNKKESDDRIVMDDNILNDTARLFENDSPKIIGISDGVGGNAGGNLAAQFICEHACTFVKQCFVAKCNKNECRITSVCGKNKRKRKNGCNLFSNYIWKRNENITYRKYKNLYDARQLPEANHK